MLKGKHIVLGISGSIAAYKAAMLARLLIKQGAEVQIVITPSGKEFITPITLSAITSKPVISEFFSGRDGSWYSHVDIGLWADAMIIAPATAATIGKMAHGIADNMLITTYLSMKAPVFIAPAMDLDMYAHSSTRDNLLTLESRGNLIIEPGSGFLASHLEGKGRMQEPEIIVETLNQYFSAHQTLNGHKVLITAGPTHEAIDPVRFIGNHSTGKMGIALAEAYAQRGAEVTLILGPSSLRPKYNKIKVVSVTTALEMLSETERIISDVDTAIFAAAVADYRPEIRSSEKIKREHTDKLELKLIANPDIASSMGKRKRKDQYFLCFALESRSGETEAIRKMQEKGANAIVLNSLSVSGAGFGYDTNQVKIFATSGKNWESNLDSKNNIAEGIIRFIEEDRAIETSI